MDEQFTIRLLVAAGSAVIGVLCLSFSASILPVVGLYLLIVAAPVALLAFLGMIWAAMLDIPLPAFLYPAWARPLRERNLRTERATKQWLRSHWQ